MCPYRAWFHDTCHSPITVWPEAVETVPRPAVPTPRKKVVPTPRKKCALYASDTAMAFRKLEAEGHEAEFWCEFCFVHVHLETGRPEHE